MNKILIDNLELNYIVNYKNIKNINLRVKTDKIIYVSCNKYVSIKEIEEILLKNKKFIINSLNKLENKEEENNKLYYLGKELKLVIDNNTYIDNNLIHAKDFESAKNYIYSLSSDVFNSRLDMILTNFDNLPKFKVKIKYLKTKWGVCNKRSMTVTLNSELITKPVHLIDYVIIHELCHFKHMDHSKNFWLEVEKYYPNHKQARKELR